MNYTEFAAKIKAKYPQYSDMDDLELAEKMVAKFPQYSDVTFDEVPQAAPAQPEKPGLAQQIGNRYRNVKEIFQNPEGNLYNASAGPTVRAIQAPINAAFVGAGEATGAVGDVLGAAGGKALGYFAKVGGKFIPQPVRRALGEFAQGITEATGLDKIASDYSKKEGFFGKIPQDEESQKGLKAVGYAWNILASVPVGAATKKAVEPIESGLGKGLQRTANRMQNTKIKILSAEQRMGAKPEYFGKYGLFGNAEKVHKTAKEKIGLLANELDSKIKTAAPSPENNVNISGVLGRARESILKGERLSSVDKVEYENAISSVFKKLETPYLDKDGNPLDVNLLEAQLLKRTVGKKGDWLSNPGGGIRPSPEATVESRVYNAVYDQLKKELENKGGKGIKEINRALSELIPMERAAGKRLLVSSRNNPISLDDFIGGLAIAGFAASGNILPAAVVAGNIVSKSPTVAKGLYKVGGALRRVGNPIGNQRGQIGAYHGSPHRIGPEGFDMAGAGGALAAGSAIERMGQRGAGKQPAGGAGKSALRLQRENDERERKMLEGLTPEEMRRVAKYLTKRYKTLQEFAR